MSEKPPHVGKPCSLRVIRGDRVLKGTSAQLAHISERGGWDAFLQTTAIEFVKFYNESVVSGKKPDVQIGSPPDLQYIVGGKI